MKKFNLFKMLAVLVVLITSINTAWAGEWPSTMWQVWGSDDGGTTNKWLQTGIGSGNDYAIGTITASSPNYVLKGLGVNVTGTDVKWVGFDCYWPDGSSNSKVKIDWSSDYSGGKYWEQQNLWSYTINKNANPGDYTIGLDFWMNSGSDDYNKNCRKITWTIPGFKVDDPTSFSFGSESPVNLESVAKIGVVHYGTQPTISDCELSGTNASEFEVIAIDYSGVTVVFKPTSAGAKEATLTITDAYSKTWTVTLTGTGAANTATTTLYFNDYTNHSDWSDASALYRFVCEYTSGIYTRYPMTKSANTEYTYSAEVELKSVTPSIDRYNPSSPYAAWNWCTTSLSSSNPYAISNSAYNVYVTNHPFNDVTGGTFYYDNSKSQFTNTLYLVIGHDHQISDDGSSIYSSATSLANIPNTKLYYSSSYAGGGWHDADYYGVIAATSASGNDWSSDLLDEKGTSGFTAAYKELFGLLSGSTYLGFAATEGGALNMTSSPTLNTTQTFNYAISTDGGTGYTVMKAGDPNTPGQLTLESYGFTDGTCTAVEEKDEETLSADATTYAKSVSNVAYTGTTTLTASSTRDGYTFMGWYNNNSTQRTDDETESFFYYPQGDSTFTARYKAHTFTVEFNANYPSGAVNNGASMDDQDFVYEVEQNLTANAFACEGYTFTGWKKDNATSGEDVSDEDDGSTLTTEDGGMVTLYAQWSDTKEYYYKGASASGWTTASNWTRNAVPGASDDVIALKPLQAPSGTTTVNSVRIATIGTYTPIGGDGITASGSLTIPAGSALKVATSIANCTISENAPTSGTSTTSSTLIIGSGGALAWGTSGSPGNATVGFFTNSGGVPGSQDARNDYFGIPFTSLNSDAYYNAWVFAVSGTTWGEVHGATLSPWTGYNIIEMKEESGDFGGSYSLTGELVSSGASVGSGVTAGTETLYANSWVAPIEISKMDFSGTATVYLFTPASFNQIVSAENPIGNYSSHAKNESSGVFIPSMKSFSVVSTTVSVDYATAVYGEVANAFKAPRRERMTDYRQAIWDTQDSLYVTVKSASGWGDVLKMFIHEDFSQNYENGWDGPKMEGMWEAPKLYTLNNEGEMAVSCVPTAENSVIAFHAGTASNEYTFTFKYSGEDELVLKDTKTGIETPIVDGETYDFTSSKEDDDMRFVIRKAPAVVTGTEEVNASSNIQKIMHNGALYIVRDGKIYSVDGALVK